MIGRVHNKGGGYIIRGNKYGNKFSCHHEKLYCRGYVFAIRTPHNTLRVSNTANTATRGGCSCFGPPRTTVGDTKVMNTIVRVYYNNL